MHSVARNKKLNALFFKLATQHHSLKNLACALGILHLHRDCFLEWCWTYQFRETVTDVVPLRLLMLGHSREYAHASYHMHDIVVTRSLEDIGGKCFGIVPQFDVCKQTIFVELFLPSWQRNIDKNLVAWIKIKNSEFNFFIIF